MSFSNAADSDFVACSFPFPRSSKDHGWGPAVSRPPQCSDFHLIYADGLIRDEHIPLSSRIFCNEWCNIFFLYLIDEAVLNDL